MKLIKPILITIALTMFAIAFIRVGEWITMYSYPIPGMEKLAPAEEVNIIFLLIFGSITILYFTWRFNGQTTKGTAYCKACNSKVAAPIKRVNFGKYFDNSVYNKSLI